MSGYFNDDQESYMRYIFSVPREERCACGWDLLGRCLHPGCKAAFKDSPAASAGEGSQP